MRIVTCFFVVLYLTVPSADAITLGQIDTFSGPTNFFRGFVVPSGGPEGGADAYYRIVSEGTTLSTLNRTDWSGDYVSQGIARLEVDLANMGTTPLSIRLTLSTQGPRFITKEMISPPPDGAWHRFSFSVKAEDLVEYPGGAGGSSDHLKDVTALGIYHWPDPLEPPPGVTGALGIDNIRAVPEPAVAMLILLGGGLLRRR